MSVWRNIIYLKRDIRLLDNPLFDLAEKQGIPYATIYIFEPEVIQAPWFDIRHYQFVYHSLADLDRKLRRSGHKVHMFYGSAQEVFEWLLESCLIKTVFSHQEVGADVTFKRDKRLRSFFRDRGIEWLEIPTDGIVRGLRKRDDWDKNLQDWLTKNVRSPKLSSNLSAPLPALARYQIPQNLLDQLKNFPKHFQAPGETHAIKVLQTFCAKRCAKYLYNISKPAASQFYSSRLSPYLAYGNISARVVYQKIQELETVEDKRKNIQAFVSRLFWRSHFIQKFESMPEYEFKSINKAFEPWPFKYDERLVRAWAEGETGVDLVDAVMKCLKETGWINFRMRAMVVSFLCHALQQPWQAGANILARYFLDFEPGIHFPQFQMQAGVTGYNTIRIYNPEKQLLENDPDRTFCGRWLGRRAGQPIVDWKRNLDQSKDVLWKIKKTELCKAENLKLLAILR